ncbi:hypothetical protein BH10PSE17_BH10PSE17_00410 [soil metagenome]
MSDLADMRKKLRLAREWERLTFENHRLWPSDAAKARWIHAQAEATAALEALKKARLEQVHGAA